MTDANGPGETFTWSSPQMIADVQSWLDNPSTNFGWTILGDESKGQTAKRVNSSESTTLPNVPPQVDHHLPRARAFQPGAGRDAGWPPRRCSLAWSAGDADNCLVRNETRADRRQRNRPMAFQSMDVRRAF